MAPENQKTPRIHQVHVNELNFSFLSLTEVTECEKLEPRCETGKDIPKRNKDGLYDAKSLRLNNNLLSKINNCSEIFSKFLLDVEQLIWLDLSCNEFQEIPNCLDSLKSLKILLLHGNQIKEINEVDKIVTLPNLTKLTLHGNPMECIKGYRFIVLSKFLTQQKAEKLSDLTLRSLDNGTIIRGDIANAKSIGQVALRALKKHKKTKQKDD